MAYLIYHPNRRVFKDKGITVYHDKFGGNEDPYLWNDKFLHTYCHITQMTNVKGQVNFWVSGEKFTEFSYLLCDCVFVTAEKRFWESNDNIKINDPIVDNPQHLNTIIDGQILKIIIP